MRGRTFLDLCRTVFAVGVLYAFALQGFVGVVAQAESGIGPLCSHDSSEPQVPADGSAACCLVACMTSTAAAAPASASIATPLRSLAMVVWQPAAHLALSAAIAPAFHARGPPSA